MNESEKRLSKATNSIGRLELISECWVQIPSDKDDKKKPPVTIFMDNLPDISDSKSANYSDESAIGRSNPYKNFGYSENRVINMTMHFVISGAGDAERNLRYLRRIESAVYPKDGGERAPFKPPPICKIKCGKLLAEDAALCVVLKSYSVKFPTEVAFDRDTFCPFKFDVDTVWEVVYSSMDLPGQDRIITSGR